MVANPTPKPLTMKERQALGIRNKIADIQATMPPLYNRRERKNVKRLEKMLKNLERS